MSRLVPSLLLATAAGALSCVSPAGPLEAVPGIDEPRGGGADGWLDTIDPASCPGGGPRLVRGAPATWTVIHYAAGDNDLEEAMQRDINEMELGHGGSPNVNVVVQLDRRTEDGAWRYEIRPDTTANDPDRSRIVSRLAGFTEQELDSGDVATFTGSGRWAVACYPAERYVVVIGGHGKGWSTSGAAEDEAATARSARAVEHGEPRRAIAPDDRSESEIYVDELAAALSEIRTATRRDGDPPSLNRLVLFGSDACLMGTIEVAYDLRDAVSYLVGSEAAEPTAGWPYSTITRELTHRPTYYAASPERLAAEIVAAYGRSYGPTGAAGMVRDDITIAALDTAATARVRDRVDRVASLALSSIAEDREGGDEVREALAAARATSPTFGLVYADLGGLLASFRAGLLRAGAVPEPGAPWEGDPRYPALREAIDDLLEGAWGEYVVASHVGEAWAGGMGLGVYMPRRALRPGPRPAPLRAIGLRPRDGLAGPGARRGRRRGRGGRRRGPRRRHGRRDELPGPRGDLRPRRPGPDRRGRGLRRGAVPDARPDELRGGPPGPRRRGRRPAPRPRVPRRRLGPRRPGGAGPSRPGRGGERRRLPRPRRPFFGGSS